MGRHCELCKVYLPSGLAEEQHEKGRKHQKAEAVRVYRRELASRSAFLYGFPAGSLDRLQLLDFFARSFDGGVCDVTVDAARGTFAIVEFADAATAERARAAKRVTVGGHGVVVAERKVDFDAAAENCLAAAGAIEADPAAILAQVRDQLPLYTDGDQCYAALVRAIEADDTDARLAVAARLGEELQHYLPSATVEVFGSCITGLATQGCDIDLTLITGVKFVDLAAAGDGGGGSRLQLQHGSSSYLNRSVQYLLSADPTELRGADHKITVDELSHLSRSDRIKYISRALNHIRKTANAPLAGLVANPKARCPIVKFVWAKRYRCDLSVDNRLAVHNARWLRHLCMEHDARIRPLLMAVRFWANAVAGVNGGKKTKGHELTSYALTLLVVVYLQSIGAVPPINARTDVTKIDGWEVGFPTEWTFTTDLTVDQLLKSFFTFYAPVAFADVVLCPFAGRILTLDEFKAALEAQDADPRIANNFKLSHMNVQDPFVLDHNTASYPSANLVNKLERKLRAAAKLLSADNHPRDDQQGGDIALRTLLVPPVTKAASKASSTPTPAQEGRLRLSIEAKTDTLESIALSVGAVGAAAVWLERARGALRTVLESVLHMRPIHHADGQYALDDEEEEDFCGPTAKRRRQTVVVDDAPLHLTYQVVHQLWQGRRLMKRQIHRETPDITEFELELEVSRRLLSSGSSLAAVVPPTTNGTAAHESAPIIFSVSEEDEEKEDDTSAEGASPPPTTALTLVLQCQTGSAADFRTMVHFLEPFLQRLLTAIIGDQRFVKD